MNRGSQNEARRWLALLVVCVGQLMIVLDSTIVNVALPSIQRDLHIAPSNLTWVVNAYLVTYGSLLLLAGRAGDLIGRKKVFLAGVIVFTLASGLDGLAPDEIALIAARALQGIGGAMSAGVIIALLVSGFPQPQERAQAMSLFAFVIAGGGSLGLLAGGVLTQAINWHWIFFVNVPIGAATFLFGWKLINENEGLGLQQGVDVLGSVLVTVAMMAAVYAIVVAGSDGWNSWQTEGFGGLAITLLVIFFVVEASVRNPILPLRILRVRGLAAGSVARAFLATGMFSYFFLGALLLQNVHGYSAVDTGLAFLPATLALAALSTGATARLMRTFGPRALLIPGLFIIAIALAMEATAGQTAGYFPTLFGSYLLFGIGGGISFMPLLTIIMSEVPAADAGVASGIANVTMQVGAALGLAALGTISSDRAHSLVVTGSSVTSALTGGYQLGLAIAAALISCSLLVVLVALRAPRRAPRPSVVAQTETVPEAA